MRASSAIASICAAPQARASGVELARDLAAGIHGHVAVLSHVAFDRDVKRAMRGSKLFTMMQDYLLLLLPRSSPEASIDKR